jgi:radical SAM superfamily enzyme
MKSQGPVCQSCAMPMDKTELFGTNKDGTRSNGYCTFCFQNGKFTEPEMTMQQMVDKCVRIMVQRNIMAEADARKLMAGAIPNLKRWKK